LTCRAAVDSDHSIRFAAGSRRAERPRPSVRLSVGAGLTATGPPGVLHDYPQRVPVRRLILLGLVLAVATALAPGVHAAPPPAAPRVAHATMVYYAVGGTTPAQIRMQLNARAPASPDGFHGDAFTRWSFRWTWPGYGSSACRLSQASVTLHVVVTFPRWTHPKAAAAAVTSAWARYARALARHEQGHVDFAVAHYPAVVRAIKGATCGSAEAAAEKQLNVIRRHDVAYDAATQHGATQGARFP
jgi:predicted secreted Zn-dependent protease